jgi:hypothetical protein
MLASRVPIAGELGSEVMKVNKNVEQKTLEL